MIVFLTILAIAADPRAIPGPTAAIREFALTPDAKHALASGDDLTYLVDLTTGRVLRRFPDHAYAYPATDGKKIALATADALDLFPTFDAPRAERLLEVGEKQRFSALTWCEAGIFVAAVWDVKAPYLFLYQGSGTKISFTTAPHHLACRNRTLAIARTGGIDIFDVVDRRILRTLPLDDRPDTYVTGLTIARDGTIAAGTSNLGALWVWDPSGKKIASRPGAAASSLAFHPQRPLLAANDALLALPSLEIRSRWRIARLGTEGVAFSPDGAQLITATGDAFYIDAVEDRLNRPPVKGQINEPESLAIAPSGALLATGTSDGRITIFELETRKFLRAIEAHEGKVHAVAFALGGTVLLSGGADRALHAWRPATGARIGSAMLEESVDIVDLSLDARGARALARGWAHATLIDVATMKKIRVFGPYKGEVGDGGLDSATLSPDGKRAAIASQTRKLLILDVETGSVLRELPESKAATFDASGTKVAAVPRDLRGEDACIVEYDLSNGTEIARHKIGTENIYGDADALMYLAGGGGIAWWGWSGTFGIAARRAAPLAARAPWHVGALVHDVKRGRLITGGPDVAISMWRTQDLALATRIPSGRGNHVAAIAFSADGRLLYASGEDAKVRVHDVTTRARLPNLPPAAEFIAPDILVAPSPQLIVGLVDNCRVAVWKNNHVSSHEIPECSFSKPAGFSKDGKRAAILDGMSDRAIVWDVEKKARIREFSLGFKEDTRLEKAVWSPDEKRLLVRAVGDEKDAVYLYDVASGRRLGHLEVIGGAEAIFAADGKIFVLGAIKDAAKETGIAVWWSPPAKPKPVWPQDQVNIWTHLIAFSPDGTRLAQAHGPSIWIRDITTGAVLTTLVGHEADIDALAFSPDGTKLATGTRWEGDVRLWDAATGRALATWKQLDE